MAGEVLCASDKLTTAVEDSHRRSVAVAVFPSFSYISAAPIKATARWYVSSGRSRVKLFHSGEGE